MLGDFPPNPRYGVGAIILTSGLPANDIGNDGWLASDPTTGALYVKANGSWKFIATGTET